MNVEQYLNRAERIKQRAIILLYYNNDFGVEKVVCEMKLRKS